MTSGAARSPGALDRALAPAVMAGMLGAVAMTAVGMLVSAAVGRGLFTPLYAASALLDPAFLTGSVQRASEGDAVSLTQEPALVGSALILTTGGLFGVGFGLLARLLRPRGARAVAAGLGYGVVVLVLMGFVVLPLAGAVAPSQRPVPDLVTTVGWWVLAAQNVVFGLVVGGWVLLRPADVQSSGDRRRVFVGPPRRPLD